VYNRRYKSFELFEETNCLKLFVRPVFPEGVCPTQKPTEDEEKACSTKSSRKIPCGTTPCGKGPCLAEDKVEYHQRLNHNYLSANFLCEKKAEGGAKEGVCSKSPFPGFGGPTMWWIWWI
jgi:hypothetical protein